MEKMQPIKNTADPDILQDGDTYYLIFACREGELAFRAFQCYQSTDLTNWSEPWVVLNFKDFLWAHKMGWAPTMTKFRDKYYICFCADQQIGIAASDSPRGPFTDILGRPLIPYGTYGIQTIDPCLYVENDHMYLFWGQGKCFLAELDVTEGAAFKESPICISDEFYSQSSCTEPFDITIYNEAPDIVKINNRYLLSWSIYDYRDARYRVRYAWADDIHGPYIQPRDEHGELDNILIQGHGKTMGTGHACVAKYQGEYYLFYHRHAIPRKGYGRETCRGKIQFLTEEKIRVVPEDI